MVTVLKGLTYYFDKYTANTALELTFKKFPSLLLDEEINKMSENYSYVYVLFNSLKTPETKLIHHLFLLLTTEIQIPLSDHFSGVRMTQTDVVI